MTAAALRAWRTERHITQTELAESLQVHSRTIAAWEATRQAIPPYLEVAPCATSSARWHPPHCCARTWAAAAAGSGPLTAATSADSARWSYLR